MMKKAKIYCALDTKNIQEAIDLTNKIKDFISGIKLGLEFFSANGYEGVKKMASLNVPIFLDLKYFDIKNTVVKAIGSLEGLPIKYLSLHTLNGKETLLEAKKKANLLSNPIKLIGITILTSFSEKTLKEIGFQKTIDTQVSDLAKIAKEVGLDAIVCSPHEIKSVKKICKDMEIFTPGIRIEKINQDDQYRTMNPKEAFDLGADYLVMGRSITNGDPVKNIKKILNLFN